MSAAHKEDGIVSRAEANICLTCEKKRCSGDCDRLHREKRRLRAESKKKPKPRTKKKRKD